MAAVLTEGFTEETPSRRALRRLARRRGALFGLAIVAFFILVAVLAPLLAQEEVDRPPGGHAPGRADALEQARRLVRPPRVPQGQIGLELHEPILLQCGREDSNLHGLTPNGT